jgi:hypothetical protein
MYTKADLNKVYEKLAESIDISEVLFDKAEDAYKDLGRWLDKETPNDKISIYPQGSFALGTVIKPLTEADDYDLDLVCQFNGQNEYSADYLKNNKIKPLLDRYDKVLAIEEKRRCWQVQYEKTPNFHMDIIPALNASTHIKITNKKDDKSYSYIGSNPKGYIDWFNQRKKVRYEQLRESMSHEIRAAADVEPLKEYRLKTPLQKAIQILKRHRDIMFSNDKDNVAPISIIITTIAAQLYNNEDNIVDTLSTILNCAISYVETHRIGSVYHIDNPSYTGPVTENFADKWNEHPERAEAFFDWVDRARNDFLSDNVFNQTRVQLAESLKKSTGEGAVQRAFAMLAEADRVQIKNQEYKVNVITGALSPDGIVPVQQNHHHGK